MNSVQVWSPLLDRAVPFGQIVTDVDTVWEPPLIYRRDRVRTMTAQCDPTDDTAPQLLSRLRPAIEGRTPVMLDANEMEQIQAAVSWAVDRGLRPVLVGGRDADKVASLLIEHDVPVVVEGTHSLPGRRDAAYDERFTLPARLHEAGLTVCIANGGGSSSERNLPYQAATAVAYGLPHEIGIRAITLTPAEVLGVADQYGSIQSGKSATLIVTDGDPLEITTQVHEAFIDGRRVNLTNKQRELRDKYREKYRQLGEIE